MDKEYEQKFMRAISEFSDRARRIDSIDEANRCIEIYQMLYKAKPQWAEPIMFCIFEVIGRRMMEMFNEEASKDRTSGVYVILFSDGHIKIGRTEQFDFRLKMISDQSACPVEDQEFFPCEESSRIEAAAHRFFADSRLKNEFFSADFDHAREVVRALISTTNEVKH